MEGRKPDYIVYSVVEREGRDKASWIAQGVGFINSDDSITVKTDVFPKLVLQRPRNGDRPAVNADD